MLPDSLKQSGKIPAFLIHLGIGAALVATLAAVVYTWWYPPPYFEFDGGWNVMRYGAVELALERESGALFGWMNE